MKIKLSISIHHLLLLPLASTLVIGMIQPALGGGELCLHTLSATDEKQMSSEKRELLAQVEAGLKNPRLAKHLEDARGFEFINGIKAKGAVSLLVGNHSKINRRANLSRYTKIAKSIADSGRFVLYDADASTASVIAAAAGSRAIGISGHRSDRRSGHLSDRRSGHLSDRRNSSGAGPLIVKIENMNMRMDAFGENSTVISGTDSMVGMGLAIHGKSQWIFDATGTWKDSLASWNQHLTEANRNLGMKFSTVSVLNQTSAFDVEQLPTIDVVPLSQSAAEKSGTTTHAGFAELSELQLAAALEHANAVVHAEDAAGQMSGAVVFGSAKVDPHSAQLVDDVSFVLGKAGITGWTGGAGGAMMIANTAFFRAGAGSIGVPIMGRDQLKNESKVHSDVQTATAGVPNYNVRIYILLTGKSLVIFVPGGSGTMRELGATMTMLAADPKQTVKVGFVDPDYYKELTDLLMALPLPRSFKNRIAPNITAENAVEAARGR